MICLNQKLFKSSQLRAFSNCSVFFYTPCIAGSELPLDLLQTTINMHCSDCKTDCAFFRYLNFSYAESHINKLKSSLVLLITTTDENIDIRNFA